MGLKPRNQEKRDAIRRWRQIRLDANGQIIPEDIDLEVVERDDPRASPAEKWRLAQAQRLVRAHTGKP